MQRLKIIFLVVSFCVLVFCSVRFFFNYNRSIGITETRTPANIEDDIYDVNFSEYLYSDGITDNSFISIPNYNYLVYDSSTKIVYYFFNDYYYNSNASVGYGYLSPYYSKNGKICRYINNKITEIN